MRYYLISILFLKLSFGIIADPSDPVRSAGDIGQLAVPFAALWLTFHNQDHNGTIQFCKASISTILSTHLLKMAIDKDRPDGSNSNSFPSGHTSAAFTGATFIHRRYGLNTALPAYAMASFVGFSRVHAQKHYWEDVIAGAALAGVNSWLFAKPLNNGAETRVSYIQGSGVHLVILF
jgi:membrane-associated phospholipid phosphatase